MCLLCHWVTKGLYFQSHYNWICCPKAIVGLILTYTVMKVKSLKISESMQCWFSCKVHFPGFWLALCGRIAMQRIWDVTCTLQVWSLDCSTAYSIIPQDNIERMMLPLQWLHTQFHRKSMADKLSRSNKWNQQRFHKGLIVLTWPTSFKRPKSWLGVIETPFIIVSVMGNFEFATNIA